MSTIRFEATLMKSDAGTLLTLPALHSSNVKQGVLPSRGKVMIEGVINHFPFRAAYEAGDITISEAIRKAAKADIGDTVAVELTRVGDEPETRVPADLQKALNAAPKAKELWPTITPMARRDWVLSILVVKQEETRTGRLVKTTDMLAHGKGRVCCFPGLNWLTKDHVSKAETWQSLPRPRT